MLCSEASLVNHGDRAIRAITLRCRCWSCDTCLPIRAARLVKDIAAGEPDKLLTLTTRVVEGGDRDAEARRQGQAFAALMRLVKKRFPGVSVAYFVVREATKQGWPHMHVALRSPYIPQAWLKEKWLALSGSPGVDIRKVYACANAAKYLAKYIGKDPHKFGNSKRYWSSKNWFDVRPEARPASGDWDSKWFIVREQVCQLAQAAWFKRWEIKMGTGNNYFEARAPP